MRLIRLLLCALLASLPVSAQVLTPSPQSLTTAFSSTCTATSCATWLIGNAPVLTITVSGTFTGTLTFRGSGNGQNFSAILVTNLADGTTVSTTTAAGQFAIANTGLLAVRVEATAMSAGGANVWATRGGGSVGPVTTSTASGVTSQVVGNVANDSPDSGNPVKTGGKAPVASEVTPAFVTTGDRVDGWYERDGALAISNREMPRVDDTWGTTTTTCADGSINSCPVGSYLELNVNRAGSAVFWMRPDVTGNVSGGQITFDMSVNGGTSWVEASCSNGDYTQTTVLLSGSTFLDGAEAGWRCPPQAADRLRIRLEAAVTCAGGPGTCTLVVSGRATAVSMAPFTIARQGDATRLNAQVQGAVANGDAASALEKPLKTGGVAYGVVGESLPTLSNFPAPVDAADQATLLTTLYNEARVMQSDRYLDSTIAANAVSRVIATEGLGTLMIAMPSSTWTGTVVFEQSTDGVTYVAAVGIDTIGSTFGVVAGVVCAGTCAGAWQVTTLQQGYRFFRVRSTAWTSGTAIVRLVGYNTQRSLLDLYYTPFIRQDHPARFTCGADNIAATLTELSSGCSAATVASTLSLYITDITAQSTTSTAGQFILRSGTGTNCGTNTASVYPSAATAVRWTAPANTSPPFAVSFTTPIKVSLDHGLCVLGVATNTVTIQVSGWIAP